MLCAALASEWALKYSFFKGEKGKSDTKYPNSCLKTRLGLGIGLDIHQWFRLGLGLVFPTEAVLSAAHIWLISISI